MGLLSSAEIHKVLDVPILSVHRHWPVYFVLSDLFGLRGLSECGGISSVASRLPCNFRVKSMSRRIVLWSSVEDFKEHQGGTCLAPQIDHDCNPKAIWHGASMLRMCILKGSSESSFRAPHTANKRLNLSELPNFCPTLSSTHIPSPAANPPPAALPRTWRLHPAFRSRPYFFPVWIVQEIVVAKSYIIRCGSIIVERNPVLGVEAVREKFYCLKSNISATLVRGFIKSMLNRGQRLNILRLLITGGSSLLLLFLRTSTLLLSTITRTRILARFKSRLPRYVCSIHSVGNQRCYLG